MTTKKLYPQDKINANPYLHKLQVNGWVIYQYGSAIMPQKQDFKPDFYCDVHSEHIAKKG